MSTIINNFNITVQGPVSGAGSTLGPASVSHLASIAATEKNGSVVTPATTFNELLDILRSRPEARKAAKEELESKEAEKRLNRLYQELREAGLETLEDVRPEDVLVRADRRPGAVQLRNETLRLAKVEVCGVSLEVFVNGYAVYDNGDRKTVLWVPGCGKETYVFTQLKDNEKEYMQQKEELGLDVLGVLPWFNALVLAGEDQIERNLDHPKSAGTMSDKDVAEMEDLGERTISAWEGPAHFDDPETAYLKKEAREERRAALTEKQREVYDLYYEGGYTQDEVAEMLGISRETVKEQLKLARNRIKAQMEE